LPVAVGLLGGVVLQRVLVRTTQERSPRQEAAATVGL
jgi:hypothetical protein